jgi:hypothetical protein
MRPVTRKPIEAFDRLLAAARHVPILILSDGGQWAVQASPIAVEEIANDSRSTGHHSFVG